MNKASIDIGSNTVQFLLVDESFHIICREQFVTSLGKNIDATKTFDKQSMLDTFEALKVCTELSQDRGVNPKDIIVTATEASRVVENSEDFFLMIKKKLGLDINLISPQDEAFYSSRGFLFSKNIFDADEYILLDIGGASSELIKIQPHPFKVLETISLPIGSVRMKSWNEQGSLDTHLKSIFDELDLSAYEASEIIGLAGTATSLMGIHLGLQEFSENLIDDKALSFDDISILEKKLDSMSDEELIKLYPFLGKRAYVIKYGLKILKIIQDKVKFKNFKVSTKSLVHGSIQGLK